MPASLRRAAGPLLFCLIAARAASPARAATVDTSGGMQALVQVTRANIGLASTGAVCVHVQAGASQNPGPGQACSTSLPAPSPAGLGGSKAKFVLVGGGDLEPNVHTFSNQTSAGSGAAVTTAQAAGEWAAVAVMVPMDPEVIFGAVRDASARVSSTDAAVANRGRAVGEARDPLEFSTPVASNLGYTVSLSDLRLKSDSSQGRNRIRIAAGFENVKRNGVAPVGPLWTLTISAHGALSSNAGVTVDLTFWSGLGITAAQEAAAESALRDQLQPLPDGSIGLQDDVPLFGDDALLPEIVLDHPANQTVRYSDSLTTDSELGRDPAPVPALPGPLAAWLALALLTLGGRRVVRAGLARRHAAVTAE